VTTGPDGSEPASSESLYIAELRAAAVHAGDETARALLNRTAERLGRDEDLDIQELLLLSVAAMAIQTPGELAGWGRSVARRHAELAGAVQALIESASARHAWSRAAAFGRRR
jgi:hypothetical protein